jgi:Uma2 family endonuclease
MGVLIGPGARTVEIYHPGREPVVFTDLGTVVLEPEMPGFVLELVPFFEA